MHVPLIVKRTDVENGGHIRALQLHSQLELGIELENTHEIQWFCLCCLPAHVSPTPSHRFR